MLDRCLPSSFSSNRLKILAGIYFEEFRDDRRGGHFVHRNERILAIRTLHVATMSRFKVELNPTYDSGGDIKNV